ncbi:hypothetical protein ACFL2V_04220 [Pseudomonadota bacterium]
MSERYYRPELNATLLGNSTINTNSAIVAEMFGMGVVDFIAEITGHGDDEPMDGKTRENRAILCRQIMQYLEGELSESDRERIESALVIDPRFKKYVGQMWSSGHSNKNLSENGRRKFEELMQNDPILREIHDEEIEFLIQLECDDNHADLMFALPENTLNL